MFGPIDYFLVFALLAAIIGLPVMSVRALMRSKGAGLKQDGKYRVLTASRTTLWMALFILVAPVAIAINIRSKMNAQPDFNVWADAKILILFAMAAIILCILLIARMYLRTIKYDEQTVQSGFRTHRWSDLDSVGFLTSQTSVFIMPEAVIRSGGTYDSSKLTINFNTGDKIVVLPDMEGRKEFIADLKKIARQQGKKFTTAKKS